MENVIEPEKLVDTRIAIDEIAFRLLARPFRCFASTRHPAYAVSQDDDVRVAVNVVDDPVLIG